MPDSTAAIEALNSDSPAAGFPPTPAAMAAAEPVDGSAESSTVSTPSSSDSSAPDDAPWLVQPAAMTTKPPVATACMATADLKEGRVGVVADDAPSGASTAATADVQATDSAAAAATPTTSITPAVTSDDTSASTTTGRVVQASAPTLAAPASDAAAASTATAPATPITSNTTPTGGTTPAATTVRAAAAAVVQATAPVPASVSNATPTSSSPAISATGAGVNDVTVSALSGVSKGEKGSSAGVFFPTTAPSPAEDVAANTTNENDPTDGTKAAGVTTPTAIKTDDHATDGLPEAAAEALPTALAGDSATNDTASGEKITAEDPTVKNLVATADEVSILLDKLEEHSSSDPGSLHSGTSTCPSSVDMSAPIATSGAAAALGEAEAGGGVVVGAAGTARAWDAEEVGGDDGRESEGRASGKSVGRLAFSELHHDVKEERLYKANEGVARCLAHAIRLESCGTEAGAVTDCSPISYLLVRIIVLCVIDIVVHGRCLWLDLPWPSNVRSTCFLLGSMMEHDRIVFFPCRHSYAHTRARSTTSICRSVWASGSKIATMQKKKTRKKMQ